MGEPEALGLMITHWMDRQDAENNRLAASSDSPRRELEATRAHVARVERATHFTIARSVLLSNRIAIVEALALIPDDVGLRDQAFIALKSIQTLDSSGNEAFTDRASPFDLTHWFTLIAQANDSWTQQFELIRKRTA